MVVNRKLTLREENARKNLCRIYEKAKQEEECTHQKINKALGWSNSVFGQYTTGRIPLNPRAVAKLADYFRVYPEAIDPEIGKEFKSAPENPLSVFEQLERLSQPEIRKLVFDLSKQLNKADSAVLMKALIDRLEA